MITVFLDLIVELFILGAIAYAIRRWAPIDENFKSFIVFLLIIFGVIAVWYALKPLLFGAHGA